MSDKIWVLYYNGCTGSGDAEAEIVKAYSRKPTPFILATTLSKLVSPCGNRIDISKEQLDKLSQTGWAYATEPEGESFDNYEGDITIRLVETKLKSK